MVAGQALKILEGKAAGVPAGIRWHATTFGYSTAERAGADRKVMSNALTAPVSGRGTGPRADSKGRSR